MMNTKKIAALLLTAAVCLTTLAACGGEAPADRTSGSVSESTPPETGTSMSAPESTSVPADTGSAAAPMTPEEEAAAIQRVVDKLNTGVFDIRTGEKTDDEIAWFRFEAAEAAEYMNYAAPYYDDPNCDFGFEDLCYFVKVPRPNVNGVPEYGDSGFWVYHIPTDTLVQIDENWRFQAQRGRHGSLQQLACKMTDPRNLYMLYGEQSGPMGERCMFPFQVHFRLTPQLTDGKFDCGITWETEPYYAPVSEDVYVVERGAGVGTVEPEHRARLLGIDGLSDGIALLGDFAPGERRYVDGGEWRMDNCCPRLRADFRYDAETHTMTVTIPCTPDESVIFGDLGIQNVYIESAELREYKTHGAQLVLRLTEYARYYTVVEDEVFAPDCPPAQGTNVHPTTGKVTNHDVYAQCYYRNLKILFSVGEYEQSEERMTHAEGFPYHVYADPMTWRSAWESVDAAWTPMDLREALVPYVRAVQESGYMPSQTLDEWPKRPSAQF